MTSNKSIKWPSNIAQRFTAVYCGQTIVFDSAKHENCIDKAGEHSIWTIEGHMFEDGRQVNLKVLFTNDSEGRHFFEGACCSVFARYADDHSYIEVPERKQLFIFRVARDAIFYLNDIRNADTTNVFNAHGWNIKQLDSDVPNQQTTFKVWKHSEGDGDVYVWNHESERIDVPNGLDLCKSLRRAVDKFFNGRPKTVLDVL